MIQLALKTKRSTYIQFQWEVKSITKAEARVRLRAEPDTIAHQPEGRTDWTSLEIGNTERAVSGMNGKWFGVLKGRKLS